MRTNAWKMTLCMVMILAVVACLPAMAQPGGEGGPGAPPPPGGGGFAPPGGPGGPPGMMGPGMMGPGMGMGRMMGPGMGAPAAPVVVVADGVVYVAFDGRIIAFEAKTLRKLAEANYGGPRRMGPGMGPMGPGNPGMPGHGDHLGGGDQGDQGAHGDQ